MITIEDTFPHVVQHMGVSARISKWIVQMQEFDYTVMVEELYTGSFSWHPDSPVQGKEGEEGVQKLTTTTTPASQGVRASICALF